MTPLEATIQLVAAIFLVSFGLFSMLRPRRVIEFSLRAMRFDSREESTKLLLTLGGKIYSVWFEAYIRAGGCLAFLMGAMLFVLWTIVVFPG